MFAFNHVFEDFIDFEFVPYGNLNIEDSIGMCSDKKDTKCYSTIFQALVVDKYMGTELSGDLISGANRAINFINCVFQQYDYLNVFRTLESCSNQNLEPDDYHHFIGMMNTANEETKRVVKAMKDRTQAVKQSNPTFKLPYVMMNDKESVNALNDLLQEACSKYEVSKIFINF